DRILRLELGKQSPRGRDAYLGVVPVALGEAPGSHRQARVEAVEDELRRAASYTDDLRRRVDLAVSAAGQLRLFVAREQLRDEPVAPLDLAEERLAVLRVADGARRDEQRPLGAERLGGAAVVGEDVADAGDREGEEAASRFDALAEAGDACFAVELLDAAVLDIGDEQPSGVRAEVDRRGDHLCG